MYSLRSHPQVSGVREFTWHSGTVATDLGSNPGNSLELCSRTGYSSKVKNTSEKTSLPSYDGRRITLSKPMRKIQQIDSEGLIYLRNYYEHKLLTLTLLVLVVRENSDF